MGPVPDHRRIFAPDVGANAALTYRRETKKKKNANKNNNTIRERKIYGCVKIETRIKMLIR